jgi:LacI family transcriptional regulator
MSTVSRRATIEDVARRAGVSVATVSNFLNQKGRMSDATRRRIEAAMEEVHFTPNSLMRAILGRRTRILGVLTYGVDGMEIEPHTRTSIPLLAGVYAAATAAHQDILLVTGWEERQERQSGLDLLNGVTDGLLWACPDLTTPPAILRVAAAGLPVVALLNRHVPEGAGSVVPDNRGGMEAVLAHLLAFGHRRIAFFGSLLKSDYVDRYAAYRDCLARAGGTPSPALEWTGYAGGDQKAAVEVMATDLLRADPRPTAVVTPDDGWAMDLWDVLHRRGVRVPEDLSLAGFNDMPLAANYYGVGLTSVRQSYREIGEAGVNALLSLIEGKPPEGSRVVCPVSFVARRSTAPPAT